MDFDPQQGHEQSGRRPALVISNDILNHHSSMAMVCPITNTNKHHPFHIECDQAKMLDIKARNGKFRETCPEDIWTDARDLITSFM